MSSPHDTPSVKKIKKNDTEMNEFNEIVPNETKLRIIKDIKMIHKNASSNPNILYCHDKTNILKGYAVIIGPEDTVYEHGMYIFDIIYPRTYPHEPPKFKFRTTLGVRMHPNFYVNGKVCLSLINEWRGEGWTSSQNILGVLLTISSVMTNNALTHEPGIKLDSRHDYDIKRYDEIIHFANLNIALLKLLQGKVLDIGENSQYYDMVPKIREYVLENKEKILGSVEKMAIVNNEPILYRGYYYDIFFEHFVDYPVLLKNLNELYRQL